MNDGAVSNKDSCRKRLYTETGKSPLSTLCEGISLPHGGLGKKNSPFFLAPLSGELAQPQAVTERSLFPRKT